MTDRLARRIGVGPRELVSIVGAGGKTTLLQALGCDLARDGHRVILTTTTRMAADQITDPVCWSSSPRDVGAAMAQGSPLFVMSEVSTDKAVGLPPDAVDRLYHKTPVDYILVEADGARSMSIKAPAGHEPVIPRRSTLVIVVMGADALGKPLFQVAHRPECIAELTGTTVDTIVTIALAASVLLHPDGGLRNIPQGARVVIVITKVSDGNTVLVPELVEELVNSPSVDRVVTFPHARWSNQTDD